MQIVHVQQKSKQKNFDDCHFVIFRIKGGLAIVIGRGLSAHHSLVFRWSFVAGKIIVL